MKLPEKINNINWFDLPNKLKSIFKDFYASTLNGVQSITGDGVGGTSQNVIINFPTPSEIGAQEKLTAGESIDITGNIISANVINYDTDIIELQTNKTDKGGYEGTAQDLKNEIDGAVSGYKGAIVIADTPTADGIYTPTEAGTYANAGSLVYAPSTTDNGKIVQFIKTGATWVKNSIQVDGLADIQDVFTPSINLINPENLIGGVIISGNGTVSAQNNWVATNKIAIEPSTDYVLIGCGTASASYGRLFFYNSSNVYLSSETVMAAGAFSNFSFTSPSDAAFCAINLANEVGGGIDPQNSVVAGTAMLALGTDVNTPYKPYGYSIDPIKVNGLSDYLLPDILVSFDPTGFEGRELITVYVRRGQSNYYIGHDIKHEYDMGEIVYKDLFRVVTATEYVYQNGVMISTGELAIAVGENECVYKNLTAGKVDFTGGVHGDEIYEIFELFLDGVKVPLDTAFDLIPAKSCHYIQKSTMHETANDVGGVPTPVSGHPVEAIHFKKTTFENSSFVSENTLVWQKVFNCLWYHGIVCLGKLQADFVYDEEFTTEEMTGSTTEFFNKVGNSKMEYYNLDNSKGATVFSKLISPISTDESCENFVWDRVLDSKYYRKPPNYATKKGVKEKSITTVIYR